MNAPSSLLVAVVGNEQTCSFLDELQLHGKLRRVMLSSARAALRWPHRPAADRAINGATAEPGESPPGYGPAATEMPQPLFWLISRRLPDMDGIALVEMLVQQHAEARFYLIDDRYDAEAERTCFRFARVKYLCRPLDELWLRRVLQSQPRRTTRTVSSGDRVLRRCGRKPSSDSARLPSACGEG